jgi:hypothetical protein
LLLIPVFEAAFCRLFGLVFLPRFPHSVSELRRRSINVRLLVRRIPHSKEQERAAAVLVVARSVTRASTTVEFVFRTKSSRITIGSPLNGGSGLTGKSGRKTANACGANASAMTIETTAHLMLAEQYFERGSDTLVQWRCQLS